MSFVIVNVSVILLARLTEWPPDSFAQYTDLLGQSKSAALSRGFTCGMGTFPILPDEYCTQNPATGPFSLVGLVITRGAVSRIDFMIRKNTFKVGDAMLLWGRPDVLRQESNVDLLWVSRGISALTFSVNGSLSYFRPLQYVSVADNPTQMLEVPG
jgi:hypothetical protein